MNELIRITENENGAKAVSARELHAFLEATERFSTWIDRQFKYGFEENIDYVGCKQFNALANQTLNDFALTIDTSKEISMLQKSEKGKQARKYFIECEAQLKQQFKLPQNYAQALIELAKKGRAARKNDFRTKTSSLNYS
ncbi:MAG: antA/AntB antirepressor family protein [Flavobacteriaceae bacterium]